MKVAQNRTRNYFSISDIKYKITSEINFLEGRF